MGWTLPDLRSDSPVCTGGSGKTPPRESNCRDGSAENQVEGPGKRTQTREGNHLCRNPTNQREANRNRRQRGDRLSAKSDHGGHQRANANEAEEAQPGHEE